MYEIEQRANAREVFLAYLSRAVRAASGKPLPVGDGKYRVLETRAEAEQWVRERIDNSIIAIDIEGVGNPDIVHPSQHVVLCLGMCDGVETVIVPEELFSHHAGRWPGLAELLEEANTCAHNGKFDGGVLGWDLRGTNVPIQIKHDTMLMHYALWPAGGDDDEHADNTSTSFAYHGLKLLGDLYLGCGNWALSREEYEDMRSVPIKRLYRYNAFDVQRTHLLTQIFRDQFAFAPKQLKAYIEVLIPASNHLGWQEDSGVCVDVEYVKTELLPGMQSEVEQLTRELIKQVDEILPGHTWPLVAKAKRLSGEDVKQARRFNPGSADQVRVVLQHQGVELPVDRKSKTGKGSTSKRTLDLLMRGERKGDPFLTSLLARRGTEKLLGTYAKPLAERSHTEHPYGGLRLFPSFHLHKTLTGRLASSGPNIQNQPKSPAIRRSYVPSRPGRVVLSVDYGQAELRVMAVLGRDDFLRGFFHAEREFNAKLAPYEKGMDLFNNMMPSVFPDIDFKAHPEMFKKKRRELKTVVYGVSYARGARDIAEDIGVTPQYAQSIIDGYLATVPGVTAWRQSVLTHIRNEIPLYTRFGRTFIHEMITEKNRDDIDRRALSFLPQSSASDCCLLAAVELGEYIRDNGLDWDMSALIHDAIVMDVPQDQVTEAMEKTGEFMLKSAAKWFPEVPFSVDPSWGWSWADMDDEDLQKNLKKIAWESPESIPTLTRDEAFLVESAA